MSGFAGRLPTPAAGWETCLTMTCPRPDDPLATLDGEQRAVAQAVDGPVLVIAGAGTGKTTAITHRIAHAVRTGRHDPARSVALTFTNRAAGEMSRRLAALGVGEVRVRTFHAAALRQLRWAWPVAVGGTFPELVTSKAGLLASAVSLMGLRADAALLRDLAAEIEWCKAEQIPPNAYEVEASSRQRTGPAGVDPRQMASLYSAYEQAKRDAGRLDFEDVLLLAIAILEERRDLRVRVRESFAHFTVDEFQDVSATQRRLLDVWLGDRDDICVVGDPNQTIYRFAGADDRHLREFTTRHPGAQRLTLFRCYRCTPEIVSVARRTLANGPAPIKDASEQAPVIDLRPEAHLVSQCESGPRPEVREFPDEAAEVAWVVDEIDKMINAGMRPSDFAILVRVNSATEGFETALGAARIPFTIRGARRFFERPEVKRGVALLRAAARTGANGPLAESVRALLAEAGWSPEPPDGAGAAREAWESLAALVHLADELAQGGNGADLTAMVAEIDRRAAEMDAPIGDAVTLASMHTAKGLEWPIVFLPSLTDGMVPLSHAKDPAQKAEELRLLYVGMTRAQRELRLSWSRSRIAGGRARLPSRFLPRDLVADASPVSRAEGRRPRKGQKPRRCRVCGKSLVAGRERTIGRCGACPGGPDPALLAALREWRRVMAESKRAVTGNRVPAFLIATDATLEALAELRPTRLDDLQNIPGVGDAKVAEFGAAWIGLIASHAQAPAER